MTSSWNDQLMQLSFDEMAYSQNDRLKWSVNEMANCGFDLNAQIFVHHVYKFQSFHSFNIHFIPSIFKICSYNRIIWKSFVIILPFSPFIYLTFSQRIKLLLCWKSEMKGFEKRSFFNLCRVFEKLFFSPKTLVQNVRWSTLTSQICFNKLTKEYPYYLHSS